MQKRYFILLMILIGVLALSSCYTTLRAPHSATSEGEFVEDTAKLEGEMAPVYLNPTIPDARWQNYDWMYYYQSAWWLDELQPALTTGTVERPEPEEYRRRFPEGNQPMGGSVVSPGGTYSVPSLSKGSENTPTPAPNTDAKTPERRDFNSGSHANPSTTPSNSNNDSSSKRDFEAGAHSNKNVETQSAPKRK